MWHQQDGVKNNALFGNFASAETFRLRDADPQGWNP
jgi:hypothetical protein